MQCLKGQQPKGWLLTVLRKGFGSLKEITQFVAVCLVVKRLLKQAALLSFGLPLFSPGNVAGY
jgi:hypothetical protein